MSGSIKPIRKRSKNNYVDREKMWQVFRDYKKAKQANPDTRVPEFLAKCFMDIANNLATKHRFRSYQHVEDMKQDAVYLCIKYIDSFDPDRGSSPFSYFTSVISNGFFQSINSERRYLYKKYKAIENNRLFDSTSGNQEGDDASYSDNEVYSKYAAENMMTFISEYETNMREKKEAAKKNGQ